MLIACTKGIRLKCTIKNAIKARWQEECKEHEVLKEQANGMEKFCQKISIAGEFLLGLNTYQVLIVADISYSVGMLQSLYIL